MVIKSTQSNEAVKAIEVMQAIEAVQSIQAAQLMDALISWYLHRPKRILMHKRLPSSYMLFRQ